MIEAHETGL
jgi:hypothetical protein